MSIAARAHMSQSARDVLEFIRTEARNHQRIPTLMEISRHFGWRSKNAANRHVKYLRELGFLDREPRKSRTLVLTPLGGSLRLPFCGRVTAGDLRKAVGGPDHVVDSTAMFSAEDGHDAMLVTNHCELP